MLAKIIYLFGRVILRISILAAKNRKNKLCSSLLSMYSCLIPVYGWMAIKKKDKNEKHTKTKETKKSPDG